MTKFVGKFRKNQDYNEDYSYMPKQKHKNEHSEIKKLKNKASTGTSPTGMVASLPSTPRACKN